MGLPPHIGGEPGLSYPIFRLPNYPQDTGTRPTGFDSTEHGIQFIQLHLAHVHLAEEIT